MPLKAETMDSPGKKSQKATKGTLGMSTKKLPPLEDVSSSNMHGTLSSTGTVQNKRELMQAVRDTNPAGVSSKPGIFWDVEGSLKTSNIDDSDVKQQMTIVENGVNYNIKRYNDLRVINDRLTAQLKMRLDELDNEKKAFENLDAMKKAETDDAMRIENLHKEVEHVEKKIMDKTHYARKLEHMFGRLKSNQLKFDAHMTGMEETMHNIKKDSAEVRLLRRGLDAGLAKAVLVLDETKVAVADARKSREVLLEQRKAEYKNAKVLNEWLKTRERMKKELSIELRGDLTAEEERFLKSQIDEKTEKTRALQRQSEEALKKLQSMEEAFTRLKQVTGVKNVEEMHEKFSNQKSNKLQLEMEVKDAERRLGVCKKNLQKHEQLFQELKSSGGGVAELNRDNILKLEEAFNDARNEQKFIKADSERIAAVLLGLHQGAQGLLQRVGPYLGLVDGGVFDLTQVGEDVAPWTETVDAMTTAEHVLSKMMEAIAGSDVPLAAGGAFEDDEEMDDNSSSQMSQSLDTLEEAPNQTNNVRIKSKKFFRDLEKNGGDDLVGGTLATGIAMDRVDTELDFLVSGGNAAEGGPGGDGNNNATPIEGGGPAASGQVNNDAHNNDSSVPSRHAVKHQANRTSMEAKRREDMEQRRQRFAERTSERSSSGGRDKDGKEGAGGGAAADEANMVLTAKLKEQKAAGDRLSHGKKPVTLPEGVTLRDDPMTKTNAFLTSMPKLT